MRLWRAGISLRREAPRRSGTHCIAGRALRVSASIGISLYPDCGWDADMLIARADAAMSRAKEWGWNRYELFTDEMSARTAEPGTSADGSHRASDRDVPARNHRPEADRAIAEPAGDPGYDVATGMQGTTA